MANFMKALLTGFRREGVEILVGMMAEQGVASLPDDWVENILDHISPRFLENPDKQKRFAKLASAPFGEHAGKVESVLVETFEELGHRKSALTEDPDHNAKVVREALQTVKKRRGGAGANDKPSKDQGDKVQKKVAPDYFTAKAAVKDDGYRDKLTEIEREFRRVDAVAFGRFERSGAFRIQTTPEELIDIAKGSQSDLSYGVERLKGLMNGQRGEGGIKAKVKAFAEDLLDDALQGDGIDGAAERLSERLTASIDRAKDRRKRLRRSI